MKPKCFVPDLKLFLHEEFYNFLKGSKRTLINLEASLCGHCNASCNFCFYKGQQQNISLCDKKLLCFLTELKEYGLKAVTWTGGGEPTLHKKFSRIIEATCDLDLSQGLFTNAINRIDYDASVFDWIRVSKTNLDWPIENIITLAKSCGKLGLCINYDGQMEVKESIEFILEVSKNIDSIKYVQVRPILKTKGEISEVEVPNLSEKARNNKKLFITDYKFNDCYKEKDYKTCFGYHFVPFLWHNGDLGCCGYNKDLIFGNIYQKSYKEMLDIIPPSINVRSDCMNVCKNNEINKIINKLFEIEDINFV